MKHVRDLRRPGNERLPPSALPMPPDDMEIDEMMTVFPPVEPFPLYANYYVLSNNRRPRALLEADWTNKPEHFSRYYGDGKGLKGCEEPVYHLSKHPKVYPDIWQTANVFVMSERLYNILKGHATDAMDTVRIEILDAEGSPSDQTFFMVDVTRRYAAVDWANSIVSYWNTDTDHDPQPSARSISMMPDLPSDLVLFRNTISGWNVYLRRDVGDIIKAMRPKIREIYLPFA